MTEYIMSLDQGTSSSRAILYTLAGEVVASAQHMFDMTFPHDGWVEQDPEVLWQTTLASGRDAIARAGIQADQIACIGITNQRETTLLWDSASGECLYNAIVWQDRRTAAACEQIRQTHIGDRSAADVFRQVTGLVVDPYFSGTKLAWLLDNVPDARARAQKSGTTLRFGTVDTFLIDRLTKGEVHATDATNASRTALFDIHQQRWSEQMLDLLNIPGSILPQVRDCAGSFGNADPAWFGAPIPITGVAGDQQAALVGQACFAPGMSKSTYGTGCFVMTNTGANAIASNNQLLTTIAYQLGGQATYALEGSLFVAGVAIKWLRDQLGLIDDVRETQAAFDRTGGDSGGVCLVPGFTGLGAPHWNPDARGVLSGLTLDSTRDQVITAFLQGIVYQSEELLTAMAGDGAAVARLRVDGGMVVNDALCQYLADILNVVVERPVDVETTALGAALLAGVGHGIYRDLEHASGSWRLEQSFESSMSEAIRSQRKAQFARATRQANLL
ncbi:MAG: glycerol kinase GlpK [Pseudomonadota bacterium]